MKKRLLACLLTAAMLVSLFPLPALAAEAERPEWMVTVFDPLDGDIAAQTVPQGGEPVLPDSLTAWAYVIEDDTAVIPPPEGLEQESEQPQTDGPEEAEDNQLPVDGQEGPEVEQLPSDNAGEPSTPDVTLVSRTAENTPEPAEKQEPDIQPVTIHGVTWEAQPEFAPDAPGEYVYTPVLPAAYEVAGEVELPAITVTVEAAREPEQTALQRVQALIDALPAPEGITLDNAEDTAAQIWDIDGASETLTEEERAALDFTRYEAVMLALAALMDDAPTVLATESDIKYLDWDDSQKKLVEKTYTGSATVAENNAENVDWGMSDGNEYWYVVENTVQIRYITISGDVRVILKDGAQLDVPAGVYVGENNSLTIYAQSTGSNMGKLTAQSSNPALAGIGGWGNCGTIIINGGTVEATGSRYGAGIGGGKNGNGGIITINGGSVTAKGEGGAGIGGGRGGSGGSGGAGGMIVIRGEATCVDASSAYGAGIGGGRGTDVSGAGGNITMA